MARHRKHRFSWVSARARIGLSTPRIPQTPAGKTNYGQFSSVSTKLYEGEVPIAPLGSASQLRHEVDTKPGRVDENDWQVSRLRRISA